MKKFLLFAILVFPVLAIAQAVAPSPSATPAVIQVIHGVASVPAWAPPSWVIDILGWVQSMPTVGPIVVKLLSWLATIAMISTILCTAVMGILKALSAGFGLTSLGGVAVKIDAFYEKVVPYLKFFSVYNSQLLAKQSPITASTSSGSPQSS